MTRAELRDGALAGLLATTGATGLLALLSALRLTSFVPLDIANTIIELTPGQIATETIEAIGEWGKRLLIVGGVAGFIAAGAALGALYSWLMRRRLAEPGAPERWLISGALLGMIALLPTLAMQLLVPANRATIPPLARSLPALALTYALAGATVGWLLYGLKLLGQEPRDNETTAARRAFLRSSGSALLALAFGGSAAAWLIPPPAPKQAGAALPPPAAPLPPTDTAIVPTATTPGPAVTAAPTSPLASPDPTATPLPAFVPAPGTRPEITEQQYLYVISASTRDPVIDPKQWRLKIHGAVKNPFELTYDELLALPRQDQTSTLACISNEVGNYLIGNCNWNGVRLRDLLERAGVEDGAIDVIFWAADGYSDSIPLARAMEPATLVAYGIDGMALEVKHGFPARIRVPALYGEKNVKWLTEIEVVTYDYLGYWQQRGWTDDATIFTTSVFDTGNPHTTDGRLRMQNGIVALGGIAFAGDRGIRKVEIQIDGGEWREARLKEAISDLSWRLWRYDWPAAPGRHTLAIRATDGKGELQTAEIRDTHPDGATGYHSIEVEVYEV